MQDSFSSCIIVPKIMKNANVRVKFSPKHTLHMLILIAILIKLLFKYTSSHYATFTGLAPFCQILFIGRADKKYHIQVFSPCYLQSNTKRGKENMPKLFGIRWYIICLFFHSKNCIILLLFTEILMQIKIHENLINIANFCLKF